MEDKENRWKADKEQIIKKFHEFKKSGKSFSLGDLMTDDQKKRLKEKNQENEKDEEVNPSSESKVYARKAISKFISKAMKSKSVSNEIEIIDDYSFTFNLDSKDYFIGYDFGSDCVVFSKGKELGEHPREIGFYEFRELIDK